MRIRPVLAEITCSHGATGVVRWRGVSRSVVSRPPESRVCIVIEKVPTVPLCRRQARHRLDADPAPGFGTTARTVPTAGTVP